MCLVTGSNCYIANSGGPTHPYTSRKSERLIDGNLELVTLAGGKAKSSYDQSDAFLSLRADMGVMQFGRVIEPYRRFNKTSVTAVPGWSIICELVGSLTSGVAENRDDKTG